MSTTGWVKRRFLAKDASLGLRETRNAGGTVPAYALVKESGSDIVVADAGSTNIHGVSVESTSKILNQAIVVGCEGEVTVIADVEVNEGEYVKAYDDGKVGPWLGSTFVGDTVEDNVGLAFGNQPANDGIEIVSDSALDTQTLRIWGTTNGGVVTVKEDIVLTGTTPVSTTKVDWGVILGVEIISGGLAIGTITIREASGNATITTITAGNSSKGVISVAAANQRGFLRIPTAVADAGTTKTVGLVGTDEEGAEVKQAIALTGATTVSFATAMRTITKLLVGDLEVARTVTIKLPTIPDSEALKVGFVTADADEGDEVELVFTPVKQFKVAQIPSTQPRTLKFTYDFAVAGGAASAITLLGSDGLAQKIPANACILRAHTEVEAAPTSGGLAEIALGVTGNDNAFKAATAFDDATFAIDTFKAVNAELPLKVTSEVSVLATITVAALTAGKFHVFVEYLEGV